MRCPACLGCLTRMVFCRPWTDLSTDPPPSPPTAAGSWCRCCWCTATCPTTDWPASSSTRSTKTSPLHSCSSTTRHVPPLLHGGGRCHYTWCCCLCLHGATCALTARRRVLPLPHPSATPPSAVLQRLQRSGAGGLHHRRRLQRRLHLAAHPALLHPGPPRQKPARARALPAGGFWLRGL